jgi:hypothetical protein
LTPSRATRQDTHGIFFCRRGQGEGDAVADEALAARPALPKTLIQIEAMSGSEPSYALLPQAHLVIRTSWLHGPDPKGRNSLKVPMAFYG